MVVAMTVTIMSTTAQANSRNIYSLNQTLVAFARDLSVSETLRSIGGNMVFSPFSIATLLNLLLLASTGNTYEQIRYVLRYPYEIEDLLIHQLSAVQLIELQHILQTDHTDSATVRVATRIFSDLGFKLESQFRRRAAQFYMTSVEQLSFVENPVLATLRINDWISSATARHITQLVRNPLSRNTRMLAANAVFFNGTWKNEFNVADTKQLTFRLNRQKTKKAATMFRQMTVPFAEFDEGEFRAVLLPYRGDRFGMLVLLPDQSGEDHVIKLEQHLTPQRLSNVIAQLRPTDINVWLPKFRFEQSISLRETLQQMGATDVFQESRASLDALSSDKGIFLNEVLHQAVVEVDERGTEAAAVTATVVNRDRFGRGFRANRPFLFIIRDSYTGVPLFWGRLIDPSP